MAYGTNRTFLEGYHAEHLGTKVSRNVKVENIIKAVNGIGFNVTNNSIRALKNRIVHPIALQVAEIVAVGDANRVAEREIFKHFEGQTHRYALLNSVAHLLQCIRFKKQGVGKAEAVACAECVTYGERLVPSLTTYRISALEGIERICIESELRQAHFNHFGFGILPVAGIGGKKYLVVKIGLIGHRRFELVAQIVVRGTGIEGVEVAAAYIHISRKAPHRPGFGVLPVRPPHPEVARAAVVGITFHAQDIDSIVEVEAAAIFIAFYISKHRFQSPAATGVDVAHDIEVHAIVDGPVKTTIFEIKTPVGRLAVGGHPHT